MALGILLLPAVGGYWFLNHWNYTRYQAVRDSGYHILFRAALFGILLYCAARGITLLLDSFYPLLSVLWDSHVPDPFTIEVILSLGLGYLAPRFLNQFHESLECARSAARQNGDHIELLVDQAMQEYELIELTLHSRKVYIGYAVESGIGRNSDTDLVLVPILSGYREKGTIKLVLTTNYVPILDKYHIPIIEEYPKLIEEYRRDDSIPINYNFLLVTPLSEVLSARMFDEDVYWGFQDDC